MPRSGPGGPIGRPLSRISPPVAGSKPPTMCRKVLFPQPDGPTIETNSRSLIVSDSRSIAVTVRPSWVKALSRFVTSRRGFTSGIAGSVFRARKGYRLALRASTTICLQETLRTCTHAGLTPRSANLRQRLRNGPYLADERLRERAQHALSQRDDPNRTPRGRQRDRQRPDGRKLVRDRQREAVNHGEKAAGHQQPVAQALGHGD